ncbi:MAG TPA: hypothetical protein VN901_10410 [Candidatus Acidoferrales bacterium]|nr:hypothetical protein [Candidatus Acidoferrales bacterium]
MRRTFFERTQSIAGTILLGLGVFILWGNLDRAVTQLRHFLGTIPPHALGVLPSAVVAASQVVEAYATDHHRFMQILLLDTLASFWPLLLVAAGAVLSRDSVTD